jgi:hypothetical protein
MALHPSQAQIDAFVQAVLGWSQTLQQCADAAVQRAYDEYEAGKLTYADYSSALQQKIAVTQSCYTMTNAASGVLLKVAKDALGPIEAATGKLDDASTLLDKIQSALLLISELVAAAAALSTAVAAPSLTTIAAAGSAVSTVALQIVKDAGQA